MPADITEDVLKENIYMTLPLPGANVTSNDLHACHQMKRSNGLILKLKCLEQNYSIMYIV